MNLAVKIYLSSDASITKLEAISAGLTGAALDRFSKAVYEAEIDVMVDSETGDIKEIKFPQLMRERGGL